MPQPPSACLSQLAERLASLADEVANIPVVIGFDAFVDEAIRIVGERKSPTAYRAMGTIADFGGWATASAGRSGSREFISEDMVPGGCSVNCGDGIATAGFPLTAFAGVGSPAHPVFDSFVRKCQTIHPLGMDPGRAIVAEFDDGKLMFCSFSHFAEFTPIHLRQQFADGRFFAACQQAKGIAITSWSVYPYMTDCWRYLYTEALCGLTHRPRFLFDLADPASRAPCDLVEMIDVIGGFESIGPVALSLNLNEANRLARAMGLPESPEHSELLLQLAAGIRLRAGISEVSIHLVRQAVTDSVEGHALVEGPYCSKPKKSVGAGDRFNAGFLAGLLLELAPRDRLLLGCASSGYYVRHAKSGEWSQLVDFLQRWSKGNIE